MEAGLLDREIVIQSLTVTNTNGDPIETWSTFATVWARKFIPSFASRERFSAEAIRTSEIVTFQIRYLPDVVTTMRIVCEGKTYRILGISELGRRDGLEIVAEFFQ